MPELMKVLLLKVALISWLLKVFTWLLLIVWEDRWFSLLDQINKSKSNC